MKDHPIIMSAPMVRALRAGRKTMTRRLLYSPRKGNNVSALEGYPPPTTELHIGYSWGLTNWHRVKAGDRLWVRENLTCKGDGKWRYSADDTNISLAKGDRRIPEMVAWAHHREQGYAPAIHMPRWASRITLLVEATKIEQARSISEDDARAEGIYLPGPHSVFTHEVMPTPARLEFGGFDAVEGFANLWCILHGPESWHANPFVVAMSGKVVEKNVDLLG